jgi:hypothetical protein
LLTSFAAILGGNLSGNGTFLVHHSVGLFWCGTGYSETGHCDRSDGDDVVFGYIENPTDLNISQLHNFASDHPDWVATIETEAWSELRKAFAPFTISVQVGSTHAQGGAQVRDQEFGQYVVGHWPTPGAAKTFPDSKSSNIYYDYIMDQAQIALGYPEGQGPDCGHSWCRLSLTYATPLPFASLAGFRGLVKSIGEAIGRSSAHEMGHHFERINVNGLGIFPYMDCGLGNIGADGGPHACQGGDNFVYNFFNGIGFPQDPNDQTSTGGQFFYLDPPGHAIHWGQSNKDWLRECLCSGRDDCK